MTHTFLPPVARRTAFDLNSPNLSLVAFERPLSDEERQSLETATHEFYSQTKGGSTRPMIDVERIADGTYGFRQVSGRELPTKEFFDQLLAWLSEQVGFADVDTCVGIDMIPLPSSPGFVHEKWGKYADLGREFRD